MLEWIANNWATLVIGIVLAAIVTIIVIHMIREKKEGKSSCGCGCANCPMSGSCHTKE